MNATQIWQTTIERLQAKVTPAVFTTWFQGTSAHSFKDGVFVIHVPTTFAREYLENRFRDVIRSILMEVTNEPVEVEIVVSRDLDSDHVSAKPTYTTPRRPYRLPKNRLTSLSRTNSLLPERDGSDGSNERNEKIQEPGQETTSPAISMHSQLPSPAHPNAHRNTHEEQKQLLYSPSPLTSRNREGLLNPRYTFNAFIVGKCNQLAHAASLAVAESPGHIYNPLFFYGGVGLGKTHLLHAVGHEGEAAGLNVLYVSSEKFTNEMIDAIRFQKTEEFRTKYRQIDILLVDDIQFIAGKESTEEEFFHTFNTLYDANKQIVVTSDRPPKAIHSLQDRLRSRFEWGLLVDIQPPEYEHRLAILRSKAELLRFAIPNSVIEYIARYEYSSVRELEGALNRVIAYGTLHDAPLSVSLAVKALEAIYQEKAASPQLLTIADVLDGICRYYNVTGERLQSKQRDREIAWPRQVAMYVMREQTNASWLQIGTALGGRDHTTIMHGWEKVHGEITSNEQMRKEIAALLEMIENR